MCAAESARIRMDHELQLDPRFSEVASGVVFVPALIDCAAFEIRRVDGHLLDATRARSSCFGSDGSVLLAGGWTD